MPIDPQEMGSCCKFDYCGDLGHPILSYLVFHKKPLQFDFDFPISVLNMVETLPFLLLHPKVKKDIFWGREIHEL